METALERLLEIPEEDFSKKPILEDWKNYPIPYTQVAKLLSHSNF